MIAKELISKLQEHPDAVVYSLGIHTNATADDYVHWNGTNYYLGK